MARYLISFVDGAMDPSEEDIGEAGGAAYALYLESIDAGVFFLAGGLDHDSDQAWHLFAWQSWIPA